MVAQLSKGLYLHAPRQLKPLEQPIHPPQTDEVQIAVRSTTLCGSDLHYYQKGRNGTIEVKEPLCLGHEAAGEIIAIGSEVVSPRIGDRVAIECGVPCDECDLCLSQRYNLCMKLRFRGSGSAWPHFQGTMQTRINHPAKWTHLLPDSISYEEGALLEPLAVAVHACRRAQIVPGSSCTIIGAGAIGLLCAIAARRAGCAHIAIADIAASRVNFACEKGFANAGFVVSAKRASDSEESLCLARETAASIIDLQLPDGTRLGLTDYSFECTGVESCVQTAVYTTKRGGKVLLVGMGTPNLTLPISHASANEIDIIPTWRYAHAYTQALCIVQSSKGNQSVPQLADIITHRFSGVDNVPNALQIAGMAVDTDGQMVVKVVVNNHA